MNLILENLDSKMPILAQTLQGINTSISKKTQGRFKESLAFKKLKKSENLESDEQLIKYLNSFDPTKDLAKYTQWIIKITGEGRIALPEDGERLLKTLGIFNKIKNSSKIDINKDINSYINFRDLEELMSKYAEMSEQGNTTVRQWEKWIKTKGYKKIYSDSKFTILKFELTGETIKIFPNKISTYESDWIPEQFAAPEDANKIKELDITSVAVSKLACGTSYCVANPETAENYLKKGPLYTIFKEGEFVLLGDYNWGQLANNKDIMLRAASGQLALFLSKVILEVKDQITHPERAAKYISAAINSGKIVNPRALEIMQNAIKHATESPTTH